MKFLPAKFWERIADAHLFTWGYLGYHVFSMLAMRLFLNSNNYFEYFAFWTSVLVLEHILIFSIFALAKRFINSYSAPLVIFGILAIGVLRTLVTTSLAIAVGADSGVAWQYQLFLGALWEFMLMVLWSNLNGAYREHRAVVNNLNGIRNSILGYRENAEVILADEQEKLLELTKGTLLPQIQLIEDAVSAGNIELASRWGVANELKGIIYNQVRPLSESLRNSAKALTAPAKDAPSHFFSVISIPKTFHIQNSIFPTFTSASLFVTFLAAPFWLLDVSWVIPSAFLSLSYFAVIYGIRRLLKNAPEVSRWVGIPALFVTAILPVLPAYMVALVFYPDRHQAAVYGSAVVFVSIIVVAIFSLLDSFDYEARLYREMLAEQNEELSLEAAIFEQQLWAARRAWSNVIHGTVQAALTAALTRLNSETADEQTIKLVKKDLDRATKALSDTPVSNIKFAPALRDLVDSWAGICEISVDISAELKRSISRDVRVTTCINELLKEAVSNAVRHGDARNAQIAIQSSAAGVLEVSVSNDGVPPVGVRKGVGSKLFDELTLDWALDFDSVTSRTILSACVPFSAAQA